MHFVNGAKEVKILSLCNLALCIGLKSCVYYFTHQETQVHYQIKTDQILKQPKND